MFVGLRFILEQALRYLWEIPDQDLFVFIDDIHFDLLSDDISYNMQNPKQSNFFHFIKTAEC